MLSIHFISVDKKLQEKKMSTFEIIRDSKSIKKPQFLLNNALKIFARKKLKFKSAEYTEHDSRIVVNCPDNITAYYCSLNTEFKKLEPGKTRIYLRLLNPSFKDTLTVEKQGMIRFIFFDPKQQNQS